MFRKKRREKILREQEARQTQERFERNERAGKEIYARMAELKNVPRENLPDAVFMLSMAAKHQGEQIRQSIKDRTRYDFDLDTLTDGDLATYLAEDAGYALRDHVTSPQTFFEALSEQLPDVHFNPSTGRRFNDGRDDPGAAVGRNARRLATCRLVERSAEALSCQPRDGRDGLGPQFDVDCSLAARGRHRYRNAGRCRASRERRLALPVAVSRHRAR
jgi:hypothetical protein